MPEAVEFTVENRFNKEKRDINIYHRSTTSAHIISHNSSTTLPLRIVGESDFLDISPVSGPGNLRGESVIDLPSWADFEFSFSSERKVTFIHWGGNAADVPFQRDPRSDGHRRGIGHGAALCPSGGGAASG